MSVTGAALPTSIRSTATSPSVFSNEKIIPSAEGTDRELCRVSNSTSGSPPALMATVLLCVSTLSEETPSTSSMWIPDSASVAVAESTSTLTSSGPPSPPPIPSAPVMSRLWPVMFTKVSGGSSFASTTAPMLASTVTAASVAAMLWSTKSPPEQFRYTSLPSPPALIHFTSVPINELIATPPSVVVTRISPTVVSIGSTSSVTNIPTWPGEIIHKELARMLGSPSLLSSTELGSPLASTPVTVIATVSGAEISPIATGPPTLMITSSSPVRGVIFERLSSSLGIGGQTTMAPFSPITGLCPCSWAKTRFTMHPSASLIKTPPSALLALSTPTFISIGAASDPSPPWYSG